MRRSALRYARRHPWQTWLSFLGIVLGVMMVTAVDLANGSARRAFELSMESLTGRVTHQVVGGAGGVPDAVFTGLKTELGIRRAAPALSGRVRADGSSFTLLGVDPVSEGTLQRRRPGLAPGLDAPGGAFYAAFTRADAVLMSAGAAASLGLEPDGSFVLQTPEGPRDVWLAGLLDSEDAAATEGLIFADIAVAQRLLGRIGSLDSIDLVLDGEQAERLRAWLPAGLALAEAGERNAAPEQMSEAFHVNLMAMSLLSLLVAALLIYNTMTLSVLQRRETLGVLRALGTSRRELFALVLGEAALLGLAASLAGLLAGLGLGRFLVTLVTRTIDDLYFNLSVTAFLPDWWSLARGLGLGLGMSLLAAALPAWHAARSRPASLQQRGAEEGRWQSRLPLMAGLGLCLLAAGWLVLQPERGSLTAGFVALTLLIFGFCFLVPGLMSAALALVLRMTRRRSGIAARMALRGIRRGIGRTGLAVAALTVAVSVTVGVGIMVGSFRGTVILWLDQTLGGDIQITGESGPEGTALDPRLAARVAGLEGVAGVRETVLHRVESEFGPVRLSASGAPARQSLFLKEAGEEQTAAFERGEGILLSEPFAWLQGLGPGDSLEVYTDRGVRDFPVLGIFYDYTSSLGMIAVHERLYRRWWEGWPVSRLTVSAAPGTGVPALAGRLRALANGEGDYDVTANADIRRLTLAIFDRTFAITNVLRLLAVLVAFVGVICALMALQLERLREYAILRATGLTPGQVSALVMIQTALMGLCAGLLALPLGMLMSDVLIDVINRRSFGWSMQHLLPAGVLAEAILLALGAALLAGLYPARRAARISPAVALREE